MASLDQIVNALQARVATILTSGGYTCNAGARVYRGREQFFQGDDTVDPDEFPLASIHLTGEKQESDATSIAVQGAELAVTLIAGADAAAPLNTELGLLADLKRAVFPLAKRTTDGRDTLDGSCDWIDYSGCMVLPRHAGGTLCEVRLDLVAYYQETLPCG